MTDAIFEVDSKSPVMIQGITGRMGRRHADLMRAYGTNIVGGTSARPEDSGLAGMQVFHTCREVVSATGAWASVAMVPPLEVLAAASEAIDAGVRLVVTIAEGVPVHDALHLKAKARAGGAVGSVLRRLAWRCRGVPSWAFCPMWRCRRAHGRC